MMIKQSAASEKYAMWHHFKNISTRCKRRKAQYGSKALKIHSITVVKRLIDTYLTKPPNPL